MQSPTCPNRFNVGETIFVLQHHVAHGCCTSLVRKWTCISPLLRLHFFNQCLNVARHSPCLLCRRICTPFLFRWFQLGSVDLKGVEESIRQGLAILRVKVVESSPLLVIWEHLANKAKSVMFFAEALKSICEKVGPMPLETISLNKF